MCDRCGGGGGVLLTEGGPVFIACESGEGIERMNGGQIRIGYFAKYTFERGYTEGDAGSFTDVHAQFFKVITFPFRTTAALPFGFDEPETFLQIKGFCCDHECD